jgi:hypothetical protein
MSSQCITASGRVTSGITVEIVVPEHNNFFVPIIFAPEI